MTSLEHHAPGKPIASLPAAWLRPLSKDYRIPLWRWLLLPGISYMAKRNGGTWVNGTIALFDAEIRFAQGKVIGAGTPLSFAIPLDGRVNVGVRPAMASERLIVERDGVEAVFMLVRGKQFVDEVRRAAEKAGDRTHGEESV